MAPSLQMSSSDHSVEPQYQIAPLQENPASSQAPMPDGRPLAAWAALFIVFAAQNLIAPCCSRPEQFAAADL